MSNEIFVDGICEIDDETIECYFFQFGSPIQHYDSHRHRPTNSCCFALISFHSTDTVDTILRKRPHLIDHHLLFVKRLLPPDTCSFTERLLPVSSLFVYNKTNKDFDEEKLKLFFSTFGQILKFDRDLIRDRLLIEYDDYDSVDRILLNKDRLPNSFDVHKNILPRVQNTIVYHGACRRKMQAIEMDEKKKSKHSKRTSHLDEQYQDLLQKTIQNLMDCKTQLRNRENDYFLLQMDYRTIQEENDKLHQLVDQQKQTINSCPMCKEHQLTIAKFQQTLSQINKQYETIKCQYQRLLTSGIVSKTESNLSPPVTTRRHHFSFSTRLNHDDNSKSEASEKDSSQSDLIPPPPGFPPIVLPRQFSTTDKSSISSNSLKITLRQM